MTGDIPSPPNEVNATAILVRLVDGLAFRYRWATDGLTDADGEFCPIEGAMSLSELLVHLQRLASWVEGTVGRALEGAAEDPDAPAKPTNDVGSLRASTLEHLDRLRQHLVAMSDETLTQLEIPRSRSRAPHPFWNLINGPLADALTHVGQVNTYRRMNGNPAPRVDVFRGIGRSEGS